MKHKKILALIFVFWIINCFLLLQNNELYSNQDAKDKRNTLPLRFSNSFVIHEWNYTWGGSGNDSAYEIGLDSSDNIYLAGRTESFGALSSDMCLLKYNTTGVLQWNYTWGGAGYEEAMGLAIDSSDNIYLAGRTESFGALGSDMCLLKYNTTGALQWNYTWGGAGYEDTHAIGFDSSENIYITGFTSSFGALGSDMCLLKYNTTGALQWNYTWGGAGYEEAFGLAIDSSDNIYIAGFTSSFGALGRDMCLLKYNTTGALQWNYTWGGSGFDYAYAIGVDSSDNIYLAGPTRSFGALNDDICLLKYNTTGALQWNYTWGGSGEDRAYAIGLDSSDNIYLAGMTESFGALGSDMCLLKYNTTGALQWNYTWGSAGFDYANAIGLDSSENIYITGFTSSFGALNWDMCLVKFDNSPPLITINSPNQDDFIGSVAPNFDISIIESFLHTTWYTLDGGTTRIIFNGLIGSINQTEWNKKGDGTVTIRFYANDTACKEGYAEVAVYKDSITPSSSISYVVHKEPNMVNKSTTFTLTADDGSGSGVSVIRYKINDSDWFEYSSPFDLVQYTYGDLLVSYQAIDELGNIEGINTVLVVLVEKPAEGVPLTIILIAILSTAGGIGTIVITIGILRKNKRAIPEE